MKGKIKPVEMAIAAALLVTLAFGMANAPSELSGKWWGVMFPSLSLSAETDGGAEAFASAGSGGYTIKFKAVEIIENIRQGIKGGR